MRRLVLMLSATLLVANSARGVSPRYCPTGVDVVACISDLRAWVSTSLSACPDDAPRFVELSACMRKVRAQARAELKRCGKLYCRAGSACVNGVCQVAP